MLTIFSTCKPFKHPFNIHQKNSITSWTLLKPRPEIILFGEESGEIAKQLDVTYIPEIERQDNKPRVDEMWRVAQDVGGTDTFCYINSDIILLQNFINAIQLVQQQFDNFLIAGQRYDLDLNVEIDFIPKWQNVLVECVEMCGGLHAPCGKDYYIFSRGIFREMPPFLIGVNGWDNWVLDTAIRQDIPTIDATEEITAIHHNHEKTAHQARGLSHNLGLFDHRKQRSFINVTEMKYKIRNGTIC